MTPSLYGSFVLDSVARTSTCAAGIQPVKLNRGLGALRAISKTAPFVGLIGTCFGIMNSFRSIGPSKSTGFYDVPECLGEALVPAFLGIAVSLFAIAIWLSLMSQVEIF